MKADDGFRDPPWSDPLDAEAVLASLPPHATMKGMFLEAMVARAKAGGVELTTARPSYVPFRSYPLREHCGLLVELARALWPREPLRQGLRRIGRGAAPALMSSTLGRVTVGVAVDPEDVLRQMAKMFSLVSEPGQIDVVAVSPGRAELALRDVLFFADSHHVGVYEGALRFAQVEDARVAVRTRGPARTDLLCTWRPR